MTIKITLIEKCVQKMWCFPSFYSSRAIKGKVSIVHVHHIPYINNYDAQSVILALEFSGTCSLYLKNKISIVKVIFKQINVSVVICVSIC